MSLRKVYQRLFKAYGEQHWWPGDTPFEIMVGAVLTQNTAWVNVERAINNLKAANVLSPSQIIELPQVDLAELLRPSGYFNVKAKRLRHYCEWYVANGELKALKKWPLEELRAAMLNVHGIGPETADDILLYAFQQPVFVIDAYTRRLFGRLGLLESDVSYEQLRAQFEKSLTKDAQLYNEYHALIVHHAKHVCKLSPQCSACLLVGDCENARSNSVSRAPRNKSIE